MAMPALHGLQSSLAPDASLVGICKTSVRELWRHARMPFPLIEVPPTTSQTITLISHLSKQRFYTAFILSNSFRSAAIPFFAGIPERHAYRGHWRSGMITHIATATNTQQHQAYDYCDLLQVEHTAVGSEQLLSIPSTALDHIGSLLTRFSISGEIIGFLPGAARGPSKMWPEDYFIALGQKLVAERGCTIAVLGAPGEYGLCSSIAQKIGPSAVTFANALSFSESLALMNRCATIVTNDSGGMHLVWALGKPLVAIFGITDPSKTGPLGSNAIVLQKSEIRNRAVPRDSADAIQALRRVTPDDVLEQVQLLLA